MNSVIHLQGIRTNNLKNICVSIKKHTINLIIGPSGSGKSSLAYDTIAQIGLHEYQSMFADDVVEPDYRVDSYNNMLVTVPIQQTNHNNNTRSTIGSYFGLNRKIISIYSSLLGVSENFFSLSLQDNVCPHCHGSGYVSAPDINKIVNFKTPISKNPFRCWKRYGDFYEKILKEYCDEMHIDSSKTVGELSKTQRDSLLYGEGNVKYHIGYKHGNNYSRRTTKFYGVMTGKPMRKKEYVLPQSYYSDVMCPYCKGMKYATTKLKKKVWGLNIGEILNIPFNELSDILEAAEQQYRESRITTFIKSLRLFIDKSIELNLGHLSLDRSIPSLSGGELQRLRMVQLFTTPLTDLMIILDEPLTGLSGIEKQNVYENIVSLTPKHTVVLVDHSDIFVKNAGNIIALGKGGGVYGGVIIDSKKYLLEQKKTITVNKKTSYTVESIKSNVSIYNFKGFDISIANNCMNLVQGKSGIGKSTLLREYFSRYFDEYTYINQKAIESNVNSNVATLLEISSPIFTLFANKYEKEKSFFSNASGKEGACPTCLGTGYCDYGSLKLKCGECEGTGFSKILKKYQIKGKNLHDIWNMTVDEGYEFFNEIDKKVSHKLFVAKKLLLGHLKIGQLSSTLSGGENVRLKILKAENKSANIIGIDEPFKGLNTTEINMILEYLVGLRDRGKTLVIVDQSESVSQYFDYVIELRLTEKQVIKSFEK